MDEWIYGWMDEVWKKKRKKKMQMDGGMKRGIK